MAGKSSSHPTCFVSHKMYQGEREGKDSEGSSPPFPKWRTNSICCSFSTLFFFISTVGSLAEDRSWQQEQHHGSAKHRRHASRDSRHKGPGGGGAGGEPGVILVVVKTPYHVCLYVYVGWSESANLSLINTFLHLLTL